MDDARPSVVAPLVVRGKSGLLIAHEHAHETIATLVVDVLPSWRNVPIADIKVENVSGHGGSMTFKVTCDGAEPSVALHSRDEAIASTPTEQRQAAAAAVFQSHGLTPARLAEGGDWYIEAWGGSTLEFRGDAADRATPEELGTLIAKIHSVPPGWYEPFRAQLREQYPSLGRVLDDGNAVWWSSARAHEWLAHACAEDDERVVRWAAGWPTPVSRLGGRIVTTHGDIKHGNLVRSATSRTLLAIDLEFACAMYATCDLAWAARTLSWECDDRAAWKRAMLRAYVAALGEAASDAEVEELAVDVEMACLPYAESVWPVDYLAHSEVMRAEIDRLIATAAGECAHARGDAAARDELLASCLEDWFEDQQRKAAREEKVEDV
jgi:thiamine kinase-like enzyme